jgi:predicted GIY-YIG superfamily endonuclease
MKAATLYRYYDANGALLYVGVSKRPFDRLTQHQAEKPWHLEIATVRLEHLPDLSAALKAEAEAIRDEIPLHNRARLLQQTEPLEVTQARAEMYAAIGREPPPPKPRADIWRPSWNAARLVLGHLDEDAADARQ